MGRRERKRALKSTWLPPGDVLMGRFVHTPLDVSMLICKLGGKTLLGSVMCIKHSGNGNQHPLRNSWGEEQERSPSPRHCVKCLVWTSVLACNQVDVMADLL